MISGSHDTQVPADISNSVGTFKLPDPAGQGGGVCTSAMLQVLESHNGADMSWATLLRTMRTVLVQKGYDQMPQLTSSRMIDVNKSFFICPPNFKGTKRAVLIGINYTGQQGQLSECHNNVVNFLNYLKVRGLWCEAVNVMGSHLKLNVSPMKLAN
jgi:metacaspase-1